MATPAPADVLVIFGITGDLAKVMTFRSLYRLERRGLLSCPIVGVAVDDWTDDQLRDHARECIAGTGEPVDDAVFARLAARLSYVAGDFGESATYGRVADAIKGTAAAGVLPGDPAVPVRHRGRRPVRRRPDRPRPGGRREAVRPRPGVGAGARRRAAHVPRRVADLPDRPLPREDGHRGGALPPVRQRAARARVEPPQPRVRADHDGRELRRRGPRPLLRPGRSAAGRGGQPPDAARGGDGHGGPRRRRPGDDQGRPARRVPGRGHRGPRPLRPRPVRRLPRHARRGAGLDHRDLRRPAARGRQLALVGRAVLHPHRQAPRR